MRLIASALSAGVSQPKEVSGKSGSMDIDHKATKIVMPPSIKNSHLMTCIKYIQVIEGGSISYRQPEYPRMPSILSKIPQAINDPKALLMRPPDASIAVR